MIHTDYSIDALEVLLDPECLSERYYPLIPHKSALIRDLRLLGCRTKNDAAALSDECFLPLRMSSDTIRLLRRFFTMYDPKPDKFREIKKLCSDPKNMAAWEELYYLPGVKSVRASLYCLSGYRSLRDLADATVEDVLRRTASVIERNGLSCIVPLPKEVRTHIAVAKAFLWEEQRAAQTE